MIEPPKDAAATQILPQWLTYIWIWILSILAGIVSYLSKIAKKQFQHSLTRFFSEVGMSLVAGLITAHLCHAMNFSYDLTAALIAIAGMMGGKAITRLEAYWSKLLGV